MTQYDAGPGEWSDRPWDDPSRKPKPHAKRRRVTLPPWALLAILVGIVILLCVGLVMIVRAIRGGGDRATPTPKASATAKVAPTATLPLLTPTVAVTPTNTVALPIGDLATPTPFTEIAPGATILVKGTAGAGLNLREQPTTYAKILTNAKEGAELVVLEGPKESDGYVWWKLRAPDGKEGWAAANWLALKTGP
jgi:phage shock protein C